jgi:hydroxymethylpyrimidine pyrophosphatase-like HAD family hydrolase
VRYRTLACDYDGTLAHHGRVDDQTLEAIERLRASGRRLLLATGRELEDLKRVFPEVHLFDRVVAENGGFLYDPANRDGHALGPAPPLGFARELEKRGVSPLSVGHVIVATWEPNDATVLQVIRDLGLELQVVFNKGAVMVLPSGVNKATGVRRAIEELKLSLHNVVGIGDAENDHAFLTACECGVAVANAIPSVRASVDWVTTADHGAGVIELIDELIATDLAARSKRLTRHDLVIGQAAAGEVRLPAVSAGVLIAGPSGGGKTRVTTVLLERLCEAEYQVCVVDPEGDYHEFTSAIALRGGDGRALVGDTLQVLDRPSQSAVVSLLDLRIEDRPPFFQAFLPRLLELRAATGRPHWIVVDEAHHLLPSSWAPSTITWPAHLSGIAFVTVHPDHVAPAALERVETLIAVGTNPQGTVDAFTRASGRPGVQLPGQTADGRSAWIVREPDGPVEVQIHEPAADRRRHQRKYAEGELGEDRSFYFRGPEGRLNLRAQNLELFVQIADGVDDDTWRYHLEQGDVSRWFRDVIKDDALADEAAAIESRADLPTGVSRARVRAAVEQRYTKSA